VWFDADSDGDLDAACMTSAQTRVCIRNPNGTFTDVSAGVAAGARLDPEAIAPTAIAVGDLDLDLDVDLSSAYAASMSPNGASVGVFVNHERQSDLPRTLIVGNTYPLELHSRLQLPAQPQFVGITISGSFLGIGRPGRTFVPPFGWSSAGPAWTSMGSVVYATGGSSSIAVQVPMDPSLIGLTVFTQSYFWRLSLTTPVGDEILLSNVTESLIQ
jgi:hypothetical protein